MRIVRRQFLKIILCSSAFLTTCSCAAQPDAPEEEHSSTVETKLATIQVGPGKPYATPSAAARAARDGDVVEIFAGLYQSDAAVWTANNLTIRGIGRPHISANGVNVEGKGTWVIKGRNTLIENIEFSGAAVSDHNGAAIRLEGANLTLRNCYIHDNENGVLTGENLSSEVLIESCEFARNGVGDGYTHNIYIGKIQKFVLQFSYVHHAKIGHNVKSRAATSYIQYNRIMDEASGNSSYAIDTPNGGLVYVIGNSIQQGPNTDNSVMLSYAAEGIAFSDNELFVINNTFVNDNPQGRFVDARAQPSDARLINNIFWGAGDVSVPQALQSNNLTQVDPRLVSRFDYDYHLLPDSPAIDAGMEPGASRGFSLKPAAHYVHPLQSQQRVTIRQIDIGAFEYMLINSVP